MIIVAVVVCLFAVGMATFLNYFKYRSTAEQIVKGRLVVIGKSIEDSIQASLAVGLSFADLNMLPQQLERELATDEMILGIKVFDTNGTPLYSTDRLREQRTVPKTWTEAARRAGGADWFVSAAVESVVGIPIKNNFGLTVGYLAIRYANEPIDRAARAVANQLMLSAFAAFVAAALLASLALIIVIRRFEDDVRRVETALQSPEEELPEAVSKGPFGVPLRQFLQSIRRAEAELAAARGKLSPEANR